MNGKKEWYETEEGITEEYLRVSKERALEGEHNQCYTNLEYKVEIYLLDDESNVIRTETLDEYWEAMDRMKEWVQELYDKGLEETHTIMYVVTDVKEHSYYIPQVMKAWRDKTIKESIQRLKDSIEKEQRQNERNTKWREACEWAKAQGCSRLRLEYGVRRRTLIKNIVKLNLVDQWNERYPEFKITEKDLVE